LPSLASTIRVTKWFSALLVMLASSPAAAGTFSVSYQLGPGQGYSNEGVVPTTGTLGGTITVTGDATRGSYVGSTFVPNPNAAGGRLKPLTAMVNISGGGTIALAPTGWQQVVGLTGMGTFMGANTAGTTVTGGNHAATLPPTFWAGKAGAFPFLQFASNFSPPKTKPFLFGALQNTTMIGYAGACAFAAIALPCSYLAAYPAQPSGPQGFAVIGLEVSRTVNVGPVQALTVPTLSPSGEALLGSLLVLTGLLALAYRQRARRLRALT